MESKQGGDVRPLFDVNNILYEDQPPLSVSTAKQLKEYIPSGAAEWELGSDPIRILVPTGQAFVDPKASYLSFEVEFRTGATTAQIHQPCLPANASWASVFSQITCTHSSGVEIDRQRESGVWEQIRSNYDRSKPWRDNQAAQLMNQDSDTAMIVDSEANSNFAKAYDLSSRRLYGRAVSPGEQHHFHQLLPGLQDDRGYYGLNPTTLVLATIKPRVVIPMAELVRCWDSDKLMPPQLAAGMILDMETYAKEVFFLFPTTAGTWTADHKVFIKNLRLNVMTYTMTDSVQRAIAEQSITSGLAWTWKAVHSMTVANADSEFSMQVSSALSRVDLMCIKSRVWSNVYGPSNLHNDSFASTLMLPDLVYNKLTDITPDNANGEGKFPIRTNQGRCDALQVQIGSLYLPSQPIAGVEKLYHSTMEAFRAFRRQDHVGVPISLYTGRPGHIYNAAEEVQEEKNRWMSAPIGVAALSFCSSPDLPESGLSVSPQRTAVISVKYTNEKAVQRLYDLFLVHSKSCELKADSIRVFS